MLNETLITSNSDYSVQFNLSQTNFCTLSAVRQMQFIHNVTQCFEKSK